MQLDLLEHTTTSSYPLQGSLTSVETGQTLTKKRVSKRKLTKFQKEEIKARKKSGEKARDLMEEFSISESTLYRIIGDYVEKPWDKTIQWGRHLKSRYRMTLDEYAELAKRSEGRCDSCDRKFSPSIYVCVDHNHDTNDIRGLLCMACNTSLGKLQDDPDQIYKLIKYSIRTEHKPFLKSEDLHLSKTHR